MSPPLTLSCLTGAQRRVVELLAAGKDYDTCARLLSISPWTVRNHVRQGADRLPVDFFPENDPRERLLMFYAAVMSRSQLEAFAA